MSVGAGSIKRAAKTATAAKETNIAETVGENTAQEAVSEKGAKGAEAAVSKGSTDEKKQKGKAEAATGKKAKSSAKTAAKKAKNKTANTEKKAKDKTETKEIALKKSVDKTKKAPEASSQQYVAYGIGQKLPTYLL